MNDELLLIKVPRSGANQTAGMYRIDALVKSRIVGRDSINTVKPGWRTAKEPISPGLHRLSNKVYAPYMSIKGYCSDAFGTSNPDSTLAVFSPPELDLEKVITTTAPSYLGNYFRMGCL